MKVVAFVGNPNVGKSAWINALSHADFKVGNWPGVTVEKKEAEVYWEGIEHHLIDLPGIYSLTKSNNEEKITQTYLETEKIDCLVNVADATHLNQSLYLTLLLRELQIPMILLMNFEDEVIKNGIKIDLKALFNRLQVPIILGSAFDTKKIEEVKKAIKTGCEQKEIVYPLLIQGECEKQILLEIERYRNKGLTKNQAYKETLKAFQISEQGSEELAKQRLHIMEGLMKYVKQVDYKKANFTRKVDCILLHPILGIVFMLLILSILLLFVFNGSSPYIDWLHLLIEMISKYLRALLSWFPHPVSALIVDGLLAGVGGVLSFIPLMAFLYFALALLEESGYMARIAFLMDRIMSKFNLSGKAFVSFLLGFGCNVPAIASTKILEDEQSKRSTALLIPFMSCGARLPVYALFGAAFFPHQTGLIILLLYALGIMIALILSTVFAANVKTLPNRFFALELPPYRKPALKILFSKVKQEVHAYFKKATTVVLWAMLVLWAFSFFPSGNLEQSYLARFSKTASVIYEPLGFGNRWQLVASLPGSIIAKETVVGFMAQTLTDSIDKNETIGVQEDLKIITAELFSSVKKSISNLFVFENPQSNPTLNTHLANLWSDSLGKLRAFSFMVYVLLSIPCVMSLHALYRHYGLKLMLESILLMSIIPYITSLFIFQFFAFVFR